MIQPSQIVNVPIVDILEICELKSVGNEIPFIRAFIELESKVLFELGAYSPWNSKLLITDVQEELRLKMQSNSKLKALFSGLSIVDILRSEYWGYLSVLLSNNVALYIGDDIMSQQLTYCEFDSKQIPEDVTSWLTGVIGQE